MEGNRYSCGDTVKPDETFTSLNPQCSLQLHQQWNLHSHKQSFIVQPQIQDVRFRVQNVQEPENPFFLNASVGEKVRKSVSGNDEMNCDEEGMDGCDEAGRGKKESLWQRIKWTDKMVKLLITAVSYTGEDSSSDCTGGLRRKSSVSQKMGKWKCVSKVMVKRGYHVSPQQCEDKFNDLNKRYKRLNDILGRGTSCNVVENPRLLDVMDIPDKAKEEVKKILNSKQLFYEEMCSYHNGNRLYLPHDLDLQRSLRLAIRSKDDNEPHEKGQSKGDDLGKQDQHARADDQVENTEDNEGNPWFPDPVSSKRSKQVQSLGAVEKNDQTDMNNLYPVESNVAVLREQWISFRLLQLEEQKLQMRAKMLKLKQQQFKWECSNKIQDDELEKLRLQNELIKFENDQVALELKRKEMGN